jgi:hypothetical protein
MSTGPSVRETLHASPDNGPDGGAGSLHVRCSGAGRPLDVGGYHFGFHVVRLGWSWEVWRGRELARNGTEATRAEAYAEARRIVGLLLRRAPGSAL